MKISSKLILIQVIFITGLIVFILAWGIYRSGEDELFLKSARVHNEKVIDMVMSFSREKIYQPLNDNSEWDETVKYLASPTQSFEKECIDPLLQTYEINAIHVFNNIGEKRYVVTDSSESGLVTLLDSLNIGQILSIDHPKCHFFISHQQNLMEVFGATIVPTFDTTHHETPRGYLFFVKNWDTQMLQNLSILTRSNLSIHYNASQVTTSSDQKANTVVKYLPDWQGKSFAKILYSIDDPLILEWNNSSRMSTIHTSLFGIVLILVMAFVFRKWISLPLLKANNELKYSEERFRQVSESTGEWIWEVNEEGLFTYCNSTTMNIIGFQSEELVMKKHFYDLFVPSYLSDKKAEFDKLIEGHEKIRDIIFPFLHWNGSRKLLQCNAAPFYDTEGRFLGYRGTNLDITENQKILENLKLALNQAEENDRLKTAFLNNISHEIRTPVHAIIGYSTLLEDSGQNTEKRKLYTNIIHSASNQLISIIDDIISMATVEAGQEKINLSEFSLNLTLQNIYDQFQLKANEKGVILLLDKPLEDHQLMIQTDQIKLVQVLSNLLINAFKFTKEGTITFGYHLKEDVLYFYVKDTGIGISEEMHNLIFERFRQVDTSGIRQYGGMGLGLSISRAYVKLLGGYITLESKPGEGSTFTFTIPYVHAIKKMNPGNSLTEKAVVSVPDDKKTILIAEDEDLNYLLINEMLSGNHWQTIRTNNGMDTVEMCKTHPEIDLVLMDIKMPDMDGYEATRLIRKFRKELPIIVQSAYIHEEGRRRAFEAGADDFITKPFEKTQFNKVIKLYLAKKQLIRTYNI